MAAVVSPASGELTGLAGFEFVDVSMYCRMIAPRFPC